MKNLLKFLDKHTIKRKLQFSIRIQIIFISLLKH